MDPGQDDVGGHLADDMRIMDETCGAGIVGPSVGLGGGAGGEVGGEEGVQAGGRVIGYLAQPNAAGPVNLRKPAPLRDTLDARHSNRALDLADKARERNIHRNPDPRFRLYGRSGRRGTPPRYRHSDTPT